MDERTITYDLLQTLPEEVRAKIEREPPLIKHALLTVYERYGMGDGSGKNPKDYHNLHHTLDVLDAFRKIVGLAMEKGRYAKEYDESFKDSEVAASYHDVEQDRDSSNEQESASLMQTRMLEAGIDPERISSATSILMATKLDEEKKQMVNQESYLAKALADADLAVLGMPTDEYERRVLALKKEVQKKHEEMSDLKFWAGQLAFITSHNFWTEEAKELYPNKDKNTKYVKGKIAELSTDVSLP